MTSPTPNGHPSHGAPRLQDGIPASGFGCAPRDTGRRRVFNLVWPFLAIPAVLTGLFSAFSPPLSFERVALGYLANLAITLGIGGVITLNYHVLLRRAFERSRRTSWHVLLHVVAVGSGVFIGVEISLRVLGLFGSMSTDVRPAVYQVGLVVATVIVFATVAFERLREHARSVELREERARRELLHAQLQALQARTNPHFLFNSLNSVAALIEEDPKRAEKAVGLLSAVFRYSLEGSRRTLVPLQDEITAVKEYLEVEGIRFGERLTSSVQCEPGTEKLHVPPLVLQPLVENAVLHGVATQRQGGTVEVRASRENGWLVMTVDDDGPGPGGSSHSGSRTAVADLQERLRLLYGDAAALAARQRAAGGTSVRVQIPIDVARRGDVVTQRLEDV